MSRWIVVGIALGLMSCSSEPKPDQKPARPAKAELEPKLPDRIVHGSPECRLCKPNEHGVCQMLWRYGCGEATCGQDIQCDAECCEASGD